MIKGKSYLTWRALSIETISFSVSVKLVKKLPNKETIGAAYERANPTCRRTWDADYPFGSQIQGNTKELQRFPFIPKMSSLQVQFEEIQEYTSPGVPKLIGKLPWDPMIAITAINEIMDAANNCTTRKNNTDYVTSEYNFHCIKF